MGRGDDRGAPVGQVVWLGGRPLRSQFRHRTRRDRAARAERGREVDPVSHPVRTRQPVAGDGSHLRRGPQRQPGADPAHRHRAPAGTTLRTPDDRRVRRAWPPLCTASPTRARPPSGPSRPSSWTPADRSSPLGAYSKGMRQRVKLAQAIVNDPDLLVLDEPLEGLDPRQRLRSIELFRRLGEEGTDGDRLQPRARRGRALRLAHPGHHPGPPGRRRPLLRHP